jgi:hypothetical protein
VPVARKGRGHVTFLEIRGGDERLLRFLARPGYVHREKG